jgi:hypothetical protein
MSLKITKENLMPLAKKIGGYAMIAILVVLSFYAGRKTADYPPKELAESKNPYSHAFDKHEISIAVNENNELLLIEKKTGEYILYSNSIGMTIFQMYANKIYNESKK